MSDTKLEPTDLSALLRDLRALHKASTQGRWHWWTSNSWKRLKTELAGGVTRPVLEPCVVWHDQHPDCIVSDEDMAWIAAIHTAFPAIAERIEELERDYARMREALEKIKSTTDIFALVAAWQDLRAASEPASNPPTTETT